MIIIKINKNNFNTIICPQCDVQINVPKSTLFVPKKDIKSAVEWLKERTNNIETLHGSMVDLIDEAFEGLK